MGRRASVLELVVVGALALVAIATLPRCIERHGPPAVLASWRLTPGVVDPRVTQANIRSTICTRGYTRQVRPPTTYTSALKVRQLRQYRLVGSPAGYQEDHLISLELGGNPTDPRNLWPESQPRAGVVDGIENELNRKVCAGELSLHEAQLQESALKHRDG